MAYGDEVVKPGEGVAIQTSADFFDNIILHGHGRRDWVEAAWAAMQAKGATWCRVSTPPDRPDEVYLEGWKVRPKDEGLHPWER